MDESRKQFEEWYMATFCVDKYWVEDRRCEPKSYTIGENILIYWECWKASRQANPVVTYLTHQGSAVSPDDFLDGEANMHETAKREEWFPLVKKGA